MPHFLVYLLFSTLAWNQGSNDPYGLVPEDCNCNPHSDTLYVTQNMDEGDGTLRCALECANLTNGREIIAFNLPDGVDSIIMLDSELPTIPANTWIINEQGTIIVDGTNLLTDAQHGFRITGDSVIIKGLTIRNFPNNAIDNYIGNQNILIENNNIINNGRFADLGDGIDFRFSKNCIIKNNRITANKKDGIYLRSCENIYVDKNEISYNEQNGISLFNSRELMLGDSCMDCGNVIIGNQEHGIMALQRSGQLELYNNFIGVHPDAVPPVPNGRNGIYFSACDTLQIGKPNAGNFISGNIGSGIHLSDSTNQVNIYDNTIGFSVVQGLGFPNGTTGIEIRKSFNISVGETSPEYANQIGFQLNHIYLADSSQHCSFLLNEYFCGTGGIFLEPGSNMDITPPENFEIISSTAVGGSSSTNEHIQLYRKNPLCYTCQGNELLGSVQTNGQDWQISFDSLLQEGDQVSLLRTDEMNNTSVFSACKTYTCDPYETTIIPVGQEHICENGTLDLLTDTGVEFIWSTGETSPGITISEGGEYSVLVLNEKGCPSTDTIYIPTFTAPDLQLFPADSTVFCDEFQLLNAQGQGLFEWNTGVSGPIIMVEESGNYCVTLTNQYKCTTSACLTIIKGEQAEATILTPQDSIYCDNREVLVTATGGTEYSWNIDEWINDSLWVSESGLYAVTVTNEFGCVDSASQFLEFVPGVDTYILPGGYQLICHGDSIELTAFGGTMYEWNTGETDSSIVVDDWSEYTVTVTNESGCWDTASQSVAMKPRINAFIDEENPTQFCESDAYWLTVQYDVMDSIVWNDTLNQDSIWVDQTGIYEAEIFNLGCSVTDSIFITVWPIPVKPDSIAGPDWSNPDSIQQFSVIPYDPNLEYIWEVDGGRILTTYGDVVEIEWTHSDMGMVCVSTIDTNGCASNNRCKIIDLAPLKNQSIETEKLLVYPNPARGTLNLEFVHSPIKQSLELEFYNTSGKLVGTRTRSISAGENRTSIDISSFPAGIYWMKINGNNRLLLLERIILNP